MRNTAVALLLLAGVAHAQPAIVNGIPAAGIPVTSLPALPTGNNTIGSVGVTALPALPAGSNAIGTVGVTGALPAGANTIGTVGLTGAVPAGSNTIGTVGLTGSLPAGTNSIGNVGVTTALPAGTNTIGMVGVTALPQVSPGAPDAFTITTANTAVTAFLAGHVAKGGWIFNPTTAAGPLCIAIGSTAGTSTSGATSCITPGSTYTIPSTTALVSANAADAGHTFSGLGYQ